MVNFEKYNEILEELAAKNVTLVAVSKLKTVNDIKKLYDLGQRDFGENYVQELLEKQSQLPKDIRWHFIGHLQSNKVKYIIPFVYLIQGVDSLKLLKEINKQAKKQETVVSCLLQVHIAQEETKFGLDENELTAIYKVLLLNPEELANVSIRGLMGMASFTEDTNKVRKEMQYLKSLFLKFREQVSNNNNSGNDNRISILSMGMSGDYQMAIEEGSNMVRIGSLLFGNREKK